MSLKNPVTPPGIALTTMSPQAPCVYVYIYIYIYIYAFLVQIIVNNKDKKIIVINELKRANNLKANSRTHLMVNNM
jgi:hypothetical protein